LGSHDSATERGSAWHLAFRTLAERPDLRNRLPAATGLDDATLGAIEEQVRAVRAWLKEEGYDKLHFEVPIQQTMADGSETNAIIDCLAEGAMGYLILDHKSGACPDPEARFAGYLPQLATYAELVSDWSGKPIRQIAIHWMSEGIITVAPAPAQAELIRS
jgi:ATP-dependent exoDNAse (exonuclease V) beta subunit